MDWFQMFLITIQFSYISTRKKHVHDSDESIENLLYYQDCKHKSTTEEPVKELLRSPVISENPCPFPKMCCSMTCGGECSNQQAEPMPLTPFAPNPAQNHFRKRPIGSMFSAFQAAKERGKVHPIPMSDGRKSNGFTREKIKGLIAQDEDIRKVLKDLVKVTLQKATLNDETRKQNEVDPNLESQEVDEL